MNTKDYTNAKEVLEDLKQYIKEKIERKNQANVTIDTVQDISLASQPEIMSDHIMEEAALPPLGENISNEVVNTGLESAVPSGGIIGENPEYKETIVIEQSPMVENIPTAIVEEVSAPAMEIVPTPEPMPVPEAYPVQPQVPEVSQTSEPIPSQGVIVPQDEIPASPTVIDTVGEQDPLPEIPNVTPAVPQVPEVMEETPTIQAGVETTGSNVTQIDTQNLYANPSVDNITSMQTQQPEQPEQVDTNEQTNGAVVQTPPPDQGAVEPLPIPDTEQAVSNSGVEVSPQYEIPGMEAIPEIVMPESSMNETGTVTYQASNTGAQAEIADVTPAMSDTNVVMPLGTTEEVANDQTLVVGPEAFTPTR